MKSDLTSGSRLSKANHLKPASSKKVFLLQNSIMTKEGEIVKACLDYLTFYGAFVWRNNTGALKDKTNRPVFFGKPGSADIIGVLPGGRFIAVECKTIKGTLSEKQKIFLSSVKDIGGLALVARSVDDVIEAVKTRQGKIE